MNNIERPFGDMTMVLGGDFRQIPSVIPNGRRHNIVTASIKKSYLWRGIHIMKLTKSMRLNYTTHDESEKQRVGKFTKWILNISDRKKCNTRR